MIFLANLATHLLEDAVAKEMNGRAYAALARVSDPASATGGADFCGADEGWHGPWIVLPSREAHFKRPNPAFLYDSAQC